MMQSRIGLRSLGRQSISLCKKSGKIDARLFSTSSYSDRDLQLDYVNFGNFWKKTWNLVFDGKERERFISLQKSGILPKDSYWSPVWTYICLDNPLLKKYDVRAADILEGAKFSYEAVNQALSTTDFYKHLRGEVEKSESHDFLSSVQSPEVYTAWRNSSKQFDATGMRFTLKSLNVTDVSIRNVMTKIVPGDVPADTEYMTDIERAAYLQATEWFDKVTNNKKNAKKDGKKDEMNTTGSSKDTLEPPVVVKSKSAKANVVQPLQNTTPAEVPAAPITTPITPATPVAPTVAPTVAPITAPPAPPISLVPPITPPAASVPVQSAPVTPVIAVTPETFKVQPATRRATRSVPARDDTEASVTAPAVTASTASNTPSSSSKASEVEKVETDEKYDEVYHIPPITAEGTPVQVEHHEADHTIAQPSAQTSANTSSATEVEPQAEEEKEIPLSKSFFELEHERFPPGAVLAYVDVQIKAHEESVILLDKLVVPEGAPIKVDQTKDRNVMWSFRACISGQVPLEWQLVDINGARAEAFRA